MRLLFNNSVILLSTLLLINSCQTLFESEVHDKDKLKTRYINLSLIFEYMVKMDPEARSLKDGETNLLKNIENIKDAIETAEKIEKGKFFNKLNKLENKLVLLREKQKYLKGKILMKIDSAVQSVARSRGLDFVFNIGEGTVYARKEYDITEDVLREIAKQNKRSSPVVR